MSGGLELVNLVQSQSSSKPSARSSPTNLNNREVDVADSKFHSSLKEKVNQRKDVIRKAKISNGDRKTIKELTKKLEQDKKLTEEEVSELLSLLQGLAPDLKEKLFSGQQGEKMGEILEKIKQQLSDILRKQKNVLNLHNNKLEILNQNAEIKDKATLIKLKSFQNQIKALLARLKQVDQNKMKLETQHKLSKLKELLNELNAKLASSKISEKLADKLKRQQFMQEKASSKAKLAKLNHDNLGRKEAANTQKGEKNSVQKSLQLSQVKKITEDNVKLKVDALNVKFNKGEFDQKLKINLSQNLKSELGMSASSNLGQLQVLENAVKTPEGKEVNFRNILQQITGKSDVLAAAKRGKNVTLQLEPKSLGKLQVKLGVKDGVVSAKIVTESSEVKELLNGNLTKLRHALSQKDVQIDQFDVFVDQEEERLAQHESGENRQQEFEFYQQQKRENEELKELDLTLEDVELEPTANTDEERVISEAGVDYVV